MQTLLDVQKSLNNKRWVFPKSEQDVVARIAQNNNLPEFLARLLHTRGVDADNVQGFLNPTLRDNFPDPFSMAGMRELAEDVAACIMGGRNIAVLADFDVDGATSGSILTRFFRHFRLDVPVYIPDRLNEGYGPSREALLSLKDQGASFVIMADCGITAFEAIDAGRDMGLDLAVFDHHEAEDQLPNATHIINPKRKDDSSGLDMLAACGVSFMACVAINSVLREQGFFQKQGIGEPPLKSWLDLVALGTVCDMVPMRGINRLLVRVGFEQMAYMNNPGIKALCEMGNLEEAPKPIHAGFVIGPRINAGSRVHRSDIGVKLLSTDSLEEARSLAWTLEKCNEERKAIQSKMMKDAVAKVEAEGLQHDPIIIVADPDWHPGLSGLVAGRLKERFGKPAVVVTFTNNQEGIQEGRGSGRSIKGVNLAEGFIAARNAGLLVKGGGHAMAGGFTIIPDRLPEFREFMIVHVESQKAQEEMVEETLIDSLATVRGAHPEFVKMIHGNVGPYGIGHEEPVFALANVRLYNVDVLKDKHVRAQIGDWEGGTRMKTIMFNGVGTGLGDYMLQSKDKPLHLAGQFQINTWMERESVEFHLSDGASV